MGVGAGAGLVVVLLAIVIWLVLDRKSPAPVAAGPTAPPPSSSNPPPPVIQPNPVVLPNPVVPPPAGNGALADDVLDKVKRATVYIRVTEADGQASGSGFFEAASGLVMTNAHVIGMLHADEPAPQKIEVVLRSGERDEKMLPAAIVAVDRASDLSVLSVDVRAAGLAAPPATLAVASAAGLRETQQVFVFGFPFGEVLGKNITVSTSSVSSLRKDKDGVLAQVQVNGGMNPGNSGGPVVDAAGNVVGVAVAGIKGTPIDFAIPGDTVAAVIRGRCSDIRVGEAFRKGDQIAVPVDVTTIDPMHLLNKFAIDWWAGDPKDVVPPSSAPPAAPAAPARQTTPLAYQPNTMTGHVDLIIPSMPQPGKVLWVQPNFVDGSGKTVWAGGVPVSLAPPVDAKPAMLTLRPQVGRTHLNLKSTAVMQLRTDDGENHSLLSNIETRLAEDTRTVDARGFSSVYDTVEHFEIGVSIDGKGPPQSPRMQRIVQDVGKLGLSLTLDGQGNVAQKKSDLRQVPQGSQDALDGMGDQMLQSLDVASPPVPAGMAQPGQTWNARRSVPIDAVDSFQTAAADMIYTFRGVRSINGQDFGILDMSGVVRPLKGKGGNLSGQVHGTAAIDLAAGRVYQVHATVDVTLDLHFRDQTLRSNGKLEVSLTRAAP
jgi:S1-C subfamily serine protease